MAEQNSRDVVDQTLSGGDPSPSDVPASITDKSTTEGDAGEDQHIATRSNMRPSTDLLYNDETRQTPSQQTENTGGDKDTGSPSMDSSKQSTGLVASRAIEMNGLASVSDGGDDTASQGGSESDASRTDGRHHTRTGSVKKPSTFKPVSFAKFAVPKAPGVPTPPKAPEKVPSASTTPLGTPQPSSRPRLVAKTTSGNSISKTGSSNTKPGGSGPDPNQVWNKNRPVQPTPAKHLTDEELKQQYGIHMTSRIQEDGGGGSEAKWADIDDDEDDWAPETIEWTDGTKVTLTHTDPAPAPGQPHEEPTQAPEPEPASTKEAPKIAAPKPTTSIGPNPTVLRLGANAERQAKAAIISSKGINDRAPSGSTSPAPPPAKSPWASLPPVDRVSPVNPSAHPPPPMRAPPTHYPHRDDARHAPLPPQEIAADDFNRQWRESAPGAPRELYNSRSGRYEPVSDNRRPSWRNEPSARGPAVLQRPGQDHGGPAEPSAAFQTHRSSHHQEGMGWNRRRTSSNVSGGSGGFGRRMSFGRADGPPRHFEGRRESQTNGMVDPALIDREHPHPHGPSHLHGGPPLSSHPPPAAGEAAPAESEKAPSTAPEAPQEDPLAMQARVMRETIRLAKQRREEEEEKEKLARDERIRQKLASLGPAPEKPQRKDSIESRKTQATTASGGAAAAAAAMHSPPKPPVPEPTGEPKQYGMMKVHHPDTVKKLVAANERDRASEKYAEKSSPHLRQATSPREAKREPVHDAAPKQQPQQQQSADQNTSQETNVEESGTHWRGNLNVSGSYQPWSTNTKLASTTPSVKNPWKPLSSDRTLGNGIFDQALGGFPSRELALRSQLALDQPTIPPALPSSQEVSTIASLPSPESRIAGYDPLSPIGRPGPIGPPSSQNPQWQQELGTPGGLGAWSNFQAVAARRDAEESEQKRQDFNANRNQSNAVNFKETWKQVRSGEEAGQRHLISGAVNQNSKSSPSNPLTGLDAPVDGLPFSENQARPLVSVPARSSRFFPHGPEQQKRTVIEKFDYERSPSPPPPEESSHPVYLGGSGRPLVHLPNPKPVVKLPPKIVAAPAPPPTFASMAAAPPRGTPASTTAMSWQEKINTLFGKKTPPVKKSSLAVTSATKEPLDVQLPTTTVSVSVSFPAKEVGYQSGDGDFAVRQVEEQDEIFEDREPGSQPPVRVPNMAPAAAWDAAQAPPQTRPRGKFMKPVQCRSVEPYIVGLGEKDQFGNLRVLIRFPGALASKICSLPKKASSAPRPRSSPNLKSRKGPKSRETSNNNAPLKRSSQQSGASSSRHPSSKASWGPRTASGSG